MCFQLGNLNKFILKSKTPVQLCCFELSGHFETQSLLFLMSGVTQIGKNKTKITCKERIFNYPLKKNLCQKDKWYNQCTQDQASLEI